jgi:hypothetical protein
MSREIARKLSIISLLDLVCVVVQPFQHASGNGEHHHLTLAQIIIGLRKKKKKKKKKKIIFEYIPAVP